MSGRAWGAPGTVDREKRPDGGCVCIVCSHLDVAVWVAHWADWVGTGSVGHRLNVDGAVLESAGVGVQEAGGVDGRWVRGGGAIAQQGTSLFLWPGRGGGAVEWVCAQANCGMGAPRQTVEWALACGRASSPLFACDAMRYRPSTARSPGLPLPQSWRIAPWWRAMLVPTRCTWCKP